MTKRLIITTDDDTASHLLSLFTDKHIISLSMETVDTPSNSHVRRTLQPHTKKHIRGTTTYETIAGAFAVGQTFTRDAARAALTRVGYSPNSSHPAVSSLVKHGFAKSVGEDKYVLLRSVPPNYKFDERNS